MTSPLETSVPTEKVTFQTADGVTSVGTFVPPAKVRAPAILMLHQLGLDKSTYQELFAPLRAAGFGLLALDFRGHGESVEVGQRKISWEDFQKKDWQGLLLDVQAALETLVKKRGVDPEQIGIIGASIGANVALQALTQEKAIKSGVLLSPGLDYRGIVTEEAAKKASGQPVLLVAAKGDTYAYDSSNQLAQSIGPDTFYEVSGDAHGTLMLGHDPDLAGRIVEHFSQSLSSAN